MMREAEFSATLPVNLVQRDYVPDRAPSQPKESGNQPVRSLRLTAPSLGSGLKDLGMGTAFRRLSAIDCRLPGSSFVLSSPGPVSRKREYSLVRLETFRNSRAKKFDRRSPETVSNEKSPHLAGLFISREENSLKTGMAG